MNHNVKINILPVIIIIFSISAIIYTVYLIINYPIVSKNKYYIIIVIFSIILFYFILILKFGKNTNKEINTLIVSTIIAIYFCEIILYFFFNLESKRYKRSDPRNKLEVIQDLRNESFDVYTNIIPAIFLETDGLHLDSTTLFPLGGISNKTILTNNENDFWPTYESDEYGFNNNKGVHDSKKINIAMIGDSFTEGTNVYNKDKIHSLLKSFGFDVINFGRGGSGPLIEYAIFKEYVVNLKPKIILWLFYEGNDFPRDLTHEIKSKFLMQYLSNDEFSQNLIKKQSIIDKALISYNSIKESQMAAQIKKDELTHQPDSKGFFQNTLNILMLNNIWNKIISLIYFKRYPIQNLKDDSSKIFKQILFKTKSKVDSWNGQLLFVYIPDMRKLVTFDKYNYIPENQYKKNIIDILSELDIQVIDLENFLFDHKYENLVSRTGTQRHFNQNGYLIVANILKGELQKILVND